jgi:hypothetical protein
MTSSKKRRFPKVKGCDHFGVFPEWLRPPRNKDIPLQAGLRLLAGPKLGHPSDAPGLGDAQV